VICARDEAELYRARDEVRNHGVDVLAVQCDVTVRPQVDGMIAGALRHFGRIDVLVNNAGMISVGPMEEMTLADYEAAMQTHFAAPVYTTLAVLPHMQRRREGRIVNIASIGGKIAAPHLLPYSASKFALVGFSEGLRAELMKDNIYVTTVCPGLIRTGSPLNALFKGRHREEFAWFATSDVTPVISIDAMRLAKRIVRAAQHGQAELITPFVANVQAKLAGLFPGFISELSALVHERVLPGRGGIGARWSRGFESGSEQVSEFARRANVDAAIEHNELPPHR